MKAYIYNSIAFNTSEGAVIDLYFISENGKKNIMRLYNFDISFLVMRFPGMSNDAFKKFCTEIVKKYQGAKIDFRIDLKENACFMFDEEMLYAEIISQSTLTLKSVYMALLKKAEEYYASIDEDSLNAWDRVLLNRTEHPFRFINYTLNIDSIKYYLATKFNIPCVGGVEISGGYEKGLQRKNLTPELLVPIQSYSFDCKNNENIKKYIKFDSDINFMKDLTLMSYDLETYTQNQSLKEEDKYIMCIGVGFFSILDQKPIWKKCLTIKDFTKEDIESLGDLVKTVPMKAAVKYEVKNEMQGGDNDVTEYIVYKSESDMLKGFINLMFTNNPIFITGFNNYAYDDPYLWKRLNLVGRKKIDMESISETQQLMLQQFSHYMINDKRLLKPPKFVKMSLKIDGEEYPDNETIKGDSCVSIDVYKIMLASNAKLYTQLGKGTLASMLRVNDVKNPYTNGDIDKYSLSYVQMFENWDNNKDIYEINHYCMYDAVTAGILLIKTGQIVDKIEMSTLTCTSIADTYYNAVTSRVLAITDEYAYKYGFALMDKAINRK